MGILPHERVAIFGRTGSGKTTFMRNFLLPHIARYAVLDPKETFRTGRVPHVRAFDRRKDQQIIRAPVFGHASMAFWNDTILAILRDGHRTIVVDEMVLVTRGHPVLPAMAQALQTGRERKVGLIMLTQKPIAVPSAMLSESEHFLIFHLQYRPDRQRVVEFAGDRVGRMMTERWYPKGERDEEEARREQSTKHDAIYYDVSNHTVRYIRQTKGKA